MKRTSLLFRQALRRPSALLVFCLFVPPFLAPLHSAAAESVDRPLPGLSFKGFGTLGMAHSDDGNAQFVRDLSQPQGLQSGWSGKTDSVFGLQANLKINEQSEAIVQGISRYRYNGTYTPELTWAFLRQDFSPDFTARVGRLGTEFYMMADSRLVGYANLTVRPPPDYYGPLVISYFDGFDLSATQKTPLGLLRGKLFAGYAAEKTPFVDPLTWKLNGSPIIGGHLDYLVGPWQIRLGHAQIRFKHDQPLSQIRYETASYEDSKAAYGIAAYRLEYLTPYLGYSRAKSKASLLTTPLPPLLGTQLSQLTAQTHSDQQTFTLGARWDFRQNLALKAQVDIIRGTPQSLFPFRNSIPGWDGRMKIVSLTLDFVF